MPNLVKRLSEGELIELENWLNFRHNSKQYRKTHRPPLSKETAHERIRNLIDMARGFVEFDDNSLDSAFMKIQQRYPLNKEKASC